ncbi:phosphatidylglycerol lysyltransferase domain-containing protein [Jidongwangia harbinensis]|uniref:phosphatidylglycerol lysyltransferase domain-containing protein n=1 Tax=Jidongwangia harbinensis TaxID=2878561 RepID=UPI001CDA3622|nr:DUF2156 domain-containing protein [Jidongwangia harbinensis]MCA2212151.1 DUF2156 domain-containing protein [Jidongwangia harbinensis]
MTLTPTSPAAHRARLLDTLRRHGDHPSGFLALEEGNEFFLDDEHDGFVAYRSAGRYRFVFSGPVGETTQEPRILDRFLADSRRARRTVVAIQVPRRSLTMFAERGFVLNQVGTTYVVDLANATLDGAAMRKTRQGVRRGERAGAQVLEAGVDLPVTPELHAQLDAVDAQWLGANGKSAKALRFLVGSRGGPLADQRRLFVVQIDGRTIGYSQCAPAFGTQPGWLYDLNRLIPGSPDVGNLQVWSVMKRLQDEGVAHLHLGFTPFADLDDGHVAPGIPTSGLGTRAMRLLARYGESLYPVAGAVAWKRKWKPVSSAPEYVAFPSRLRLGAVVRLMRLTNVV